MNDKEMITIATRCPIGSYIRWGQEIQTLLNRRGYDVVESSSVDETIPTDEINRTIFSFEVHWRFACDFIDVLCQVNPYLSEDDTMENATVNENLLKKIITTGFEGHPFPMRDYQLTDIDKQTENIIDDMPAGPPMDKLMAAILDRPIWPYSTKVEHAWKVIEWCIVEEGNLFIEYWQDGEWFICSKDLYSRKIFPAVVARSDKVDDDELPSIPIAICRYALKRGVQMGLINPDAMTG